MQLEQFPETLERCFVELVDTRATERGWGKAEFAELVWPETTPRSAAGKWAAMRIRATNTGKPQGVLIADAHRMAEVLGEDLAFLLSLAKEQARRQTSGR